MGAPPPIPKLAPPPTQRRPFRSLGLPPQVEQFALAVAEGMSPVEAYKTKVAKSTDQTRRHYSDKAEELMREVGVSTRITALRRTYSDTMDKVLGYRRETLVRYLIDLLETPVGDVDERSPLCQKLTRSRQVRGKGQEATLWEIERVEMPGKMEAFGLLLKITGWVEPEQIDVRGGPAQAQAPKSPKDQLEAMAKLFWNDPVALRSLRATMGQIDERVRQFEAESGSKAAKAFEAVGVPVPLEPIPTRKNEPMVATNRTEDDW